MKDDSIVYVVDDDPAVRDGLDFQLKSFGFKVEAFSNCTDFLSALPHQAKGCLILDVRMPKITGPELQEEMLDSGIHLPIIFLTGYGNIPLVVKTVQAGAVDFLIKPVDGQSLLTSVQKALDLSLKNQQRDKECYSFELKLTKLTAREHEIFDFVVDGLSNKLIAQQLNISVRTVEHHRSHILQKTETDSFLHLASLVDSCR